MVEDIRIADGHSGRNPFGEKVDHVLQCRKVEFIGHENDSRLELYDEVVSGHIPLFGVWLLTRLDDEMKEEPIIRSKVLLKRQILRISQRSVKILKQGYTFTLFAEKKC